MPLPVRNFTVFMFPNGIIRWGGPGLTSETAQDGQFILHKGGDTLAESKRLYRQLAKHENDRLWVPGVHNQLNREQIEKVGARFSETIREAYEKQKRQRLDEALKSRAQEKSSERDKGGRER